MSRKTIRIIAIVLAVLMLGSVLIAGLQAFALPLAENVCEKATTVIPSVGDEPMTWVIIGFVVAALALVLLFVLRRKKTDDGASVNTAGTDGEIGDKTAKNIESKEEDVSNRTDE